MSLSDVLGTERAFQYSISAMVPLTVQMDTTKTRGYVQLVRMTSSGLPYDKREYNRIVVATDRIDPETR